MLHYVLRTTFLYSFKCNSLVKMLMFLLGHETDKAVENFKLLQEILRVTALINKHVNRGCRSLCNFKELTKRYSQKKGYLYIHSGSKENKNCMNKAELVYCGNLSQNDIGKHVSLKGIIINVKDNTLLLKDETGVVRLVINNMINDHKSWYETVLGNSFVIVTGIVEKPLINRPEDGNQTFDVVIHSVLSESLSNNEPQDQGDFEIKEVKTLNSYQGVSSDIYNTISKDEGINPDINKYSKRSHTCGELSIKNVGEKVKLMGWVEFVRLNKFILLKDKYGMIQVLVPDNNHNLHEMVSKVITLGSVISVEGEVRPRPYEQINQALKTGRIEVVIDKLEVINQSEKLPFCPKSKNISTQTLLEYRYLDLRQNSDIMKNLTFRCEIIHKMRRYLIENLGFLEIETPTLFRRTPGGAQEFIVPTRNEGEFYSLVQSPQQFKQMLMIGAVDRYFQIARCYRDETARKDRQPEFTQLDMEMSFCDREGILNCIEDLIKVIWPKSYGNLDTPFPRLTYKEAMSRYGIDKPDLRIDWMIYDLTKNFDCKSQPWSTKLNLEQYTSFNDFGVHAFVARGGMVKYKKLKEYADTLENSTEGRILALKVENRMQYINQIEKLFAENIAGNIINTIECESGDVVFLGFGPNNHILKALGELRTSAAKYMKEHGVDVYNQNRPFSFVWVVDFPLFEVVGGEIKSTHHPFTRVHPEDEWMLQSTPLKARSLHYDLVLNGNEVGGGSIRIHTSTVQKEILEKILNIDPSTMSYFLQALSLGAPTHGGFAIGLDRFIGILCGSSDITDVIAFPKYKSGKDPLSGAPTHISEQDKLMYHIKS